MEGRKGENSSRVTRILRACVEARVCRELGGASMHVRKMRMVRETRDRV